MNHAEAVPNEPRDTTRIEAFSDGVFAIVVTLLAFEIRVPSRETAETAGGLLNALANRWPNYLAFTTSFLTVLVLWVNHHQLLRMFRRTDHLFRMYNGLLLMFITIVPFGTALLAEYINDSENAEVAAMIYAGIFAAVAIVWNVVWFYAVRTPGLLDPKIPQGTIDFISRAYIPSVLLYIAAALFALVHIAITIFFVTALAVFYGYLSPHRE